MTRSAPTGLESEINLIALLVIGSMLWFDASLYLKTLHNCEDICLTPTGMLLVLFQDEDTRLAVGCFDGKVPLRAITMESHVDDPEGPELLISPEHRGGLD